MNSANEMQAANQFWGREGLEQAILDTLAAAGKNVDALTLDDLAPADQFHNGGKSATVRLAGLAELSSGAQVLDVGGGLGGPARTLAAEYGCFVTVVDPTESYVRAGEQLTARLGLGDRVKHRFGSGLELPFDDRTFDVVWTQNSGMNIGNKERLYAGFHRVLKSGGVLAFQEPMAGPVQPPIYPLMWAPDASTSFLRAPAEMRALIEAAGFRTRAWEDVTAATSSAVPPAERPAFGVAKIVMGDSFETIVRLGKQNTDENRIVTVHAVFDRV
jgi:SAM-dependent methyltransferase